MRAIPNYDNNRYFIYEGLELDKCSRYEEMSVYVKNNFEVYLLKLNDFLKMFLLCEKLK